ncbi:class V chitinase Chi100 [Bimuria novae-zelandiae CBS 107.79]|uniref:chitinase n=1 Tax=Bimuria novae-zelandiae CBS 107.79 TaxID=1447943 RepID=A0A6A5V2L3_9PLEO|nr:class V chitinase Chi100 [Bimuria novae-zelandiae CBS 107.79]
MKKRTWPIVLSLANTWSASAVAANVNITAEHAAEAAASAIKASITISTASQNIPGMPTDLADARAAISAGDYTSRVHHQPRFQCPRSCREAGSNATAWYNYGIGDLDRLKACANNVPQVEITSSAELASSGGSSDSIQDTILALSQLGALSTTSTFGCNETVKFAYSGDVVAGIYVGSGLANQGPLASVLDALKVQITSDGSVAENLLVQLCTNSTSRYSMGVAISTKDSDFGSVQRQLQSWKNSTCVTDMQHRNPKWHEVNYYAPTLYSNPSTPNVTMSNQTTPLLRKSTDVLEARADCRTIQVQEKDTCASLAAECGISASDFTKYNPSSSLCSGLKPGQHVCCSSGTLPDFTPKPGADGYCATYLVKTGDSCASIGAANDLTNDQIESFNKKTWGWNGCQKLFADYNICLSTGYPPMPAPVPNAVCGPQRPNTTKAPAGTDFSTLNTCALNACCNIWGQCGTTSDFCVPSNSSTGAPGTAAPGSNGCISNCGTQIVTSPAPGARYKIAYFEAFNWQRPGLRMPVNNIDTSVYTHVHFSFITLNKDLSINSSDVADQLPLLRGMSGIKKIVSVGGWTFSTDPSTYTIFRDAVTSSANRQTLINNVVKFLNDYQLDGIDWDWEYPDEPDIPGIPAGAQAESIGYFLLLDELKQAMPAGKTVSITAPASYWYLQYFPIQALSLVVDYIVYMTYDLHGQWDYTNKYATPGCPSYDAGLGNCLRSHVNLTETINSLSMITKAGVPSNMVVVGVSSYGRSFQMSTAGCWQEQCTFTGPDSGAYKGRYTDTAGYISNFEIDEIVKQNPSANKYWDASSYSNIVVFNGTQWVAYMDDNNKATRTTLYPGLNFLGDADWAVDLQSENGGNASNGDSSGHTMYVDPNIWASATKIVTASPGVTLIWPPKPLATPTVISFPLWTTEVTYSSLTTKTTTFDDGSTSTYPWYIYATWETVLTIPPVTTTAIDVWPIIIPKSGQTTGDIILTSSVQPPPFTITITPTVSGTTSIIGASETTTSSGGIIVWGSITYHEPTETHTHGSSTTVIGGIVLPPRVTTVIPNPHPTTVPTTTDPIINPGPTPPKWTSGKPPGPSSEPGCKGCGKPCILFCDPQCPWCPPGVFPGSGPGGGSPGDPNDPDHSKSSSDSSATATGTVLFDEMFDDTWSSGFADPAAVSSFYSSMYPPPSSTPPPTPTSTPSPPTPPPSPAAKCTFCDNALFYIFEVYGIQLIKEDDLHREENGCGALTGWDWHNADSSNAAYVYFNLPFFIKAGCVERAIVSAGGPKISCDKGGICGVGKKKANAPAMPVYTEEEMEEFKMTYGNNSTHEDYQPEIWSRK